MTGSYLFNYELYYNGLMTDWGLCKGWIITNRLLDPEQISLDC